MPSALEERAAVLREVYKLRGYIVTWQDVDACERTGIEQFHVGDTLTLVGGEGIDFGQPFAIVAETTKDDLFEQMNMCQSLSPHLFKRCSADEWTASQIAKHGRIKYVRIVTD